MLREDHGKGYFRQKRQPDKDCCEEQPGLTDEPQTLLCPLSLKPLGADRWKTRLEMAAEAGKELGLSPVGGGDYRCLGSSPTPGTILEFADRRLKGYGGTGRERGC